MSENLPVAVSDHQMPYAQWKKLLQEERLPVACIDLDAFDRNIAKVAAMVKASGKTFRIATKSIRSPYLIKRIFEKANAFAPGVVKGIQCYSVLEAELLVEQGFEDIFLAYPTLQDSDLALLRDLHARGKKISMVVDHGFHLDLLSKAMMGVTKPFPILVDMDMSLRFLGGLFHFGARRSPLRTLDQVLDFVSRIQKFPELKFSGIMAYEAQIAGVGDRNPFKLFFDPLFALVRELSLRHVPQLREQVAKAFSEGGTKLEAFNGGGTGSLNYTLKEPWLTEVAVGSAFLCPHLFDYYSNIHFEPSAFFALQATRSSDTRYVTCLGGGYTASGHAGLDRAPVCVSPPGKLLHTEGTGEVQTPVRLKTNERVQFGDPIVFRHAKAGELAEYFNDYVLFSNGSITEKVPTYRGLGKVFP